MNILEEIGRDMDFTQPRIVVTGDMVLLENVSGIVMLSETAVTVSHGLRMARAGSVAGKAVQKAGRQVYTTITGQDLVIREIYEGRLLIGGTIQKAEFLQSSSAR